MPSKQKRASSAFVMLFLKLQKPDIDQPTRVMCKPTPSPVNTSQLEIELISHPNRHFVTFLMRVFNDGFDSGIIKFPVIP